MDEIKRSGPIFVARHPALDFLNTRMKRNGLLIDVFQNDEDVFHWLKEAGFTVSRKAASNFKQGALLSCARSLREAIRPLVEKRKAGRRGDPADLNAFLADAESHLQLVWTRPRAVTIEKAGRKHSPAAILGPVAESAANLLAGGDFSLVKRCEDKACVLWFCDQSKSHRRRWCSATLCGNRHKVAAYRKRRIFARPSPIVSG